MTNFVYHGSCVQGLSQIDLQNHRYIYAAKDKNIAALYMMRRGPWTLFRCFGHEKGHIPFFVERYPGQIDDFYKDVSGSIYVLETESFDDNGWCVRSTEPQNVVREIKISNVKDFLLDIESQGDLKIYRYPNRPSFIPEDDSDLIDSILKLPKNLRLKKQQEFKDLFPDLYLENQDKLETVQNS